MSYGALSNCKHLTIWLVQSASFLKQKSLHFKREKNSALYCVSLGKSLQKIFTFLVDTRHVITVTKNKTTEVFIACKRDGIFFVELQNSGNSFMQITNVLTIHTTTNQSLSSCLQSYIFGPKKLKSWFSNFKFWMFSFQLMECLKEW